jgi:hypothetical protein
LPASYSGLAQRNARISYQIDDKAGNAYRRMPKNGRIGGPERAARSGRAKYRWASYMQPTIPPGTLKASR